MTDLLQSSMLMTSAAAADVLSAMKVTQQCTLLSVQFGDLEKA